MQEEIQRLETAERSRRWKYQWWSQKEALAVVEGLAQALKEAGDGARLLLYRGLRDDGAEVVWFTVEHPSGVVAPESHDGSFNMSHPCPPFCT